ncbi:MAG: hypothetical protein ACR2QO_25100 [Acidimicrobiales bacterium]
MTGGGLPQDLDGELVGVEIGRTKVRIVVLDWRANKVRDAVERPIAKAGGPRDPIEQESSTRSAIEAGLDRLDVIDFSSMAVGATIGFPNCGVGSGPALQEWLESLGEDLDEAVYYTGNGGVSYAPASCVEFVERVFEPTVLGLNRVELAPVAAARVLQSVRSGAISLGSGVAWSARLLNNQVLEAFETVDGGFDDELQVLINGIGQPITSLDGYEIDPSFGPNRGLTAAALAPSIGVAVALLDPDAPNLLNARSTGDREAVVEQQVGVAPQTGDAVGEQEQQAWLPSSIDELASNVPDPTGALADIAHAPVTDDVDDQFEPPVDDLGLIQDELRALRTDETYQLRRPPRNIERSREFRTGQTTQRETRPQDRQGRSGDGSFDRIEAFAHPEPQPENGFHLPDFLLGALLMLAVVLAVALIVL